MCAAICVIASPVDAGYIFGPDQNGGFETGACDADWYEEGEDNCPGWGSDVCTANRLYAVTTPVRSGTRSAHIEWQDGDEECANSDNRAEILPRESAEYVEGRHYWLGIAYYLGSESDVADGGYLMQWHNGCCGGNSMSLNVTDDPLRIGASLEVDDDVTAEGWMPLSYGQWYDYVVHFVPSRDSNGIFDVWLKPGTSATWTQIVDHTGPNMHEDSDGTPYLKMGAYGIAGDTTHIVEYLDNVRIYDAGTDAGDHFADVDPSGEATPPPPPPTGTPVILQAETGWTLSGLVSSPPYIMFPSDVLQTGTATRTSPLPCGAYDVAIGVAQENDGASTVTFRVGGIDICSVTNPIGSNLHPLKLACKTGVSIPPGSTLQLYVQNQQARSRGRVDYVEFTPATVSGNLPPVITSVAPDSVVVGHQYSYQVAASDPENGTLTYSLTQSPTGMTISAAGLVTYTPTCIASFPVTVRVADGVGLFVEQSFTLNSVACQ
jgi:hypothetical protein